MFSLKKKEVPTSNETKFIDVVQLWEVRWQSRHGEYFADVRPELETFVSLSEAEEFRKSLENAFKLIKHTSGHNVRVTKAK